jgi:exodeoxyribonuclease-3
MAFSVATWNINSVRLRIGNVERFITESQPDILCLQETKTIDDFFPAEAFERLGYTHRLVAGMKGYNGVAVLSRLPIAGTEVRHWCGKEDCRHGLVRLASGVTLHNLYIPAGGDVPDVALNEKFAHKLQFLDELTAWFDDAGDKGPAILVGDLNIAPLEHDVWSHKQLLDVVSHTPVEVEKLDRLREATGMVDAVRHFVPADQKLYSWWSYRARDWDLADRGRRLDHIWVSPDLVPSLASAEILRSMRAWEKPSDHVPVMVRIGA